MYKRQLYDVTSMEADMLAAKDDVFFDVPTVGDLTVWLEKRDGTKIKVEYYNYDENFYLATVNGSGPVSYTHLESLCAIKERCFPCCLEMKSAADVML